MIAKELNIYLTNLTLAGQNADGELEWIGDRKQWDKVNSELEKLL